MSFKEQNRDVILNFGLICRGRLADIEQLQELIASKCKQLHIVYQTVTARRLFLVKKRLGGSLENGKS
ncbi:MAG: hypothetical protein DRI61_16985 [Chloroflexi bacterium]|nr:MAG: hypothetical protein DRI61_16985 [Chloroflexota bacterium]